MKKDAYAVAAAKDLNNDEKRNVTLLVGADDDYDVFEDDEGFTASQLAPEADYSTLDKYESEMSWY